MKCHIGRRAYRQSIAIDKVRKSGRRTHSDVPACEGSTDKTLIDTLEPRLLYSADHPFGFAIGAFDADAAELQNAALYQTSLALADYYQQSAALRNQPLNDAEDVFVIIDVTTEEDFVDAPDLSSYSGFYDDMGGDGAVSLREAITVANNDGTVDIIRLPDGTYDLVGDQLTATGTYIIQGTSQDRTILNQTDSGSRIISINGGSVTMIDLTISGGDSSDGNSGGGVAVGTSTNAYFENVTFTGNTAASDGGAIYTEGHTEFDNVTVTGNSAKQGAGVFVDDDGSMDIYASKIDSNSAENRGGGIYNEGELNIYESAISLNEVSSETNEVFAGGGGIYAVGNSETRIYNSVIENNNATYSGGGIYNNGDFILVDSLVSENSVEALGGGIDNRGTFAGERVSIYQNTAGSFNSIGDALDIISFDTTAAGAGINNSGNGELFLDYASIAGNTSSGKAAGIYTTSDATILNSSILSNISSDILNFTGVGGIGYNINSEERVSISNTLIADNSSDGTARDTLSYGAGDLQSAGFNFVEVSSDFIASETDILGLDPAIASLSLIDNNIDVTVENLSGVLDTGSTSGEGDTSINGKLVDATPNIGGYVFTTQSDRVFWTSDAGSIYRSDKLFTFSQKLIDGASAIDVQVDDTNHRLYWLDSSNKSIKSSTLDGAGPEVTERLVDLEATNFAIDIDNDRFFVGAPLDDDYSHIYQYFGIDTFETEEEQRAGQVVVSTPDYPADIELDIEDALLYHIESANLGRPNIGSVLTRPYGTEPTSNVERNTFAYGHVIDPYAMALKPSSDRVYWTEPTQNSIRVYDGLDTPTVVELDVDDVIPQALTYDKTDDQLLFADNEQTVYRVDLSTADFSSAGFVEQGTSPETVSHMEVVSDTSESTDAPDSALSETVNTGLSINEGESAVLDQTALQVSSDNVLPIDIVYSVAVSSSELEIFKNGSITDTFTQHDVDRGRVTFSHSGVEASSGDQEDLLLEFDVSDRDGNELAVSFNVFVNSVNDPPVLTINQGIDVAQGGEVLVTSENMRATDDDNDDAQLLFTSETCTARAIHTAE